MSAIITTGGVMVEWAKYSPYGIPFGLPGADTDSDGDCDATDISNFDSVPSYDVRYDIDLDPDSHRDYDATDKAIAQTYYQGTTLGWDTLSANPDTGTGNRKGYAGYEYHEAVSLYHIRNRVLHPELGRWTRRDPIGYVDGMNVYEYVESQPRIEYDPYGLRSLVGIRSAQNEQPIDDGCVTQSDTLQECLDCCVTPEGVTDLECAEACFDHKWDPRVDPIRSPWRKGSENCHGNCYQYATCNPNADPHIPDPFISPGHLRPPELKGRCQYNCEDLVTAMKKAGAINTNSNGDCPDSTYKIALMVNQGEPDDRYCDFHFFRQNPDGTWSDKPGCNPLQGPYNDPEEEWRRRRDGDHYYYPDWCGYLCWPFDSIAK